MDAEAFFAQSPLRDQFIAAVHARSAQHEYVAHMKMYESGDEGTGAKERASAMKTRYIVLAQNAGASDCALYKAKRNANGSFSIGKAWDLAQLRAIEKCADGHAVVALSRTYRWKYDTERDAEYFFSALATLFQNQTGALPACVGWPLPGAAALPSPRAAARPSPSPPTPPHSVGTRLPPAAHADADNGSAAAPARKQALAVPPDADAVVGADMSAPPGIPFAATSHVSEVPPPTAAPHPAPVDARTRLSAIAPERGSAAYESTLREPEEGSSAVYGSTLREPGTGSLAAGTGDARAVAAAMGPPGTAQKRGGDLAARPKAAQRGMREDKGMGGGGGTENDHAMLAHVEEMLEGFEWRSTGLALDVRGAHAKRHADTTDVIEARLLEELAALETSGIYALVESDDRVALVLRDLDDALQHLAQLDAQVGTYKMQLNARAEDIAYIEGQNRGLQVQTSNQRLLLQELEVVLATVQVDEDAMRQLAHADVATADDVPKLEHAAASLYKSILQTRADPDSRGGAGEMAALSERLAQYEVIADRFGAKLVHGIVAVVERAAGAQQSDAGNVRQSTSLHATFPPHSALEQHLGLYCGLMLYLREVSPACFAQIAAAYMAAVARCYHTELQRVFGAWRAQVGAEDEGGSSAAPAGLLRSGTLKRNTQPRERSQLAPGHPHSVPAEGLERLLASLTHQMRAERALVADLLHVNNTSVTFADYMALEPHFAHRAAATTAAAAPDAPRDMDSVLERVYASFPAELDAYIAHACARDLMNAVGLLAVVERALQQADLPAFFARALGRAHTRLSAELTHLIAAQVRAIEQTKVSVKKRRGIVPFIRAFPGFVQRMEAQLVDVDDLAVRGAVDAAYEQIARTLFSVLQSISSMGGVADEDKGQRNHYVILIENMHHLQTRVRPGVPPNAALAHVREQAQAVYGHSLAGYVQTVLRRPLGKLMDFCAGVEALLQTTPANEVTLHAAYSKAAAKKLLRDYSAKDMRKHVDALSKRVQKHFNEEDDAPASGPATSAAERDETAEVLAQVWRAAEDAFVRETERLLHVYRTCYADSISVEVTAADARRPFQAAPPVVRRR
ncbi:hypothetical protein MSPP1_000459 [Malassezia sp. CBS 17886]|nr:hypothetical protein MSPP1_000459 [Malassezia sp. CBS 17886]